MTFSQPWPPARLDGSLFVLEADEYSSLWWDSNAKFLYYRPEVLILTNIYRDHPELHKDHDASLAQYRALIAQLPPTGLLIVGDSRGSLGLDSLLHDVPCRVELLDIHEAAPEQHWNLSCGPHSMYFCWQDVEFELALPGAMNARNAACAALASQHLGLPFPEAARALQGFQGVRGRQGRLKVCPRGSWRC
jgi:UDP-N-acetylmuramate-alanine ligase